jgi:hypothetical protein
MQDQRPSLSDEIDLQELAIRAIQYLKRHFIFITTSTVAGIALSIAAYIALPAIYESRMIVLSDLLTDSYSKEITKSLKNLIGESNTRVLASRLGLTKDEAIQISSIEVEGLKRESSEKQSDRTIFIITANITNKEILPKLQNGILEFLRNNEFVKIRVRQRKEECQSMIKKIGLEIHSLDSLKIRLFSGQPIYAKSSEMLLVEPTSIYSKIVELTKEQIKYKNELELSDSIQLIEGFTVFQKPAQPKLSILLLIGFFGGFFAAIGLLIFTRLLRLANSKLL